MSAADGALEIAPYDGGPVWYDRAPDALELRDAATGALRAEATPTASILATSTP